MGQALSGALIVYTRSFERSSPAVLQSCGAGLEKCLEFVPRVFFTADLISPGCKLQQLGRRVFFEPLKVGESGLAVFFMKLDTPSNSDYEGGTLSSANDRASSNPTMRRSCWSVLRI